MARCDISEMLYPLPCLLGNLQGLEFGLSSGGLAVVLEVSGCLDGGVAFERCSTIAVELRVLRSLNI